MSKISVTLPDGSFKTLDAGATALDVANSISEGLARVVVVAKYDGKIVDLQDPLHVDGSLELFKADSPEGLDTLRHSCEHILASAVCSLFEGAQVTMGPKSHGGDFYYDFDIGRPFTPEDLVSIEKEMKRLIKEKARFSKQMVSKEEARSIFKKLGQTYKNEILDWIPGEEVSLYSDAGFTDLCRGPHLPHAGHIKAFKLFGSSGSYWRGDSSREMLQRISGIAFASKKDLKDHLELIEEAKLRDHRKIGKELGLFAMSDEVGPGLVTWLPKGARIRSIIEDFSKRMHFREGYEWIYSPHIAKVDLWKTSGHWDFYQESMFSPMEVDKSPYVVKPMNCPFHVLAYKDKPKSYRELPVRLAEFGTVYRYELSGTLHGLMRVRGFTQDDAHIFCTKGQVDAEVDRVIGFVLAMLKAFGFDEYEVKLSTRPEKYVGEPKDWELAESALKKAIEARGLPYEVDDGGGAFYGPKIDIKLKDCLGRLWQCSTIQLDFNNPDRFDLNFINDNGEKERPLMIHRALFGSFERFLGILIEEHKGALPAWLAPEQVRILPIADRHLEHCEALAKALRAQDIRVTVSPNSEKLGAKIRQAQLDKIPIMLVVGDKEAEEGGATVRLRDGTSAGSKSEADLMAFIKDCSKEPDFNAE